MLVWGGYYIHHMRAHMFLPSSTSTKLSITKLPSRGSGWEHTICALRKLWTAESTRCLCSRQPLSIKSLWNLLLQWSTNISNIYFLFGGWFMSQQIENCHFLIAFANSLQSKSQPTTLPKKNSVWTIPIGSMYGIFTNIYHKNQPNVGVYTIHGSYGILFISRG